MKSWSKSKKVLIRSPNSTRPWQHVLDALYGYITLSLHLKKSNRFNGNVFNFGPPLNANFKVIDVLNLAKKSWNKVFWKIIKDKKRVYESNLLKLNSSKANSILKWSCNLNFKETIYFVTDWYKYYYINNKNMYNFSLKQIDSYYKKIR